MTFKKYNKIHHLGDSETEGIFSPGNVVVQSKVDGAQFSFWVDENDTLHFGKHSCEMSSEETYSHKNDGSYVWKAVPDIEYAYLHSNIEFKKSLIYYGESLQKHTLQYRDDMPGFIGYDVFSLETGEFLDWKIAKQEFELIGLPFINVHFEKDVRDITIKELHKLISISPYRDDGDEGIVIKRYDCKNIYGRPLFAKIVANDFKEKNRQVFNGIKNVNTDELNITDTYCTPGRITKIIHKLIADEQYGLSMKLMPILFREVVKDILIENILTIYMENKQINFKTLEKLVATQCVKQLKIVMEENI